MTTPHNPTPVRAWGVTAFAQPLESLTITRRELRADDISIDIEYAGICHSDIHTATGDWGEREYPLVPGHEIIGRVSAVTDPVLRQLLWTLRSLPRGGAFLLRHRGGPDLRVGGPLRRR